MCKFESGKASEVLMTDEALYCRIETPTEEESKQLAEVREEAKRQGVSYGAAGFGCIPWGCFYDGGTALIKMEGRWHVAVAGKGKALVQRFDSLVEAGKAALWLLGGDV